MEHYTPIEYLKMDIASAFGKDKLVWKDRLAWYEANKDKLNFKEADEPARACAGIAALNKTLKGESTGFMCAMDATNSGVQLLSILLGSRNGCILTNAINSEERVDGYTVIHELVNQVYSCEELTRQNLKDAVMQYFYGGTATAKKLLTEKGFEAFEAVLSQILPELVNLRNYFLKNWDSTAYEYNWIMPDNFHVNCPVTETQYVTFQLNGKEYTFGYKENTPVKRGKSLGANCIHSVDAFILREMVARCMYNQRHIDELRKVQHSKPNLVNLNENTLKDYKAIQNLLALGKESGFYSYRILDYLNENTIHMVPKEIVETMLNSLPKKSFDLVTVHDCFHAHPNYIHDVREQYRNCITELSKSNMLQFLMNQIFPKKKLTITKAENLTSLIANEEYAIC